MKFAPPSPLRESDYEAIEQAVSETDRGRWFLAEYARRNRNADTDVLLAAIARLEKNLTTRGSGMAPDLSGIRLDIVDMMEAIERTKLEIAQIRNENAEQSRFEMASAELDAIVEQTEKATSEILTGAEHIQEAAWTLREQGFDDKICDDLDQHATDIYTACSFQDLTGQRIQKIVHVLSYVESRLSAMVAIWGLEETPQGNNAASVSGDRRPDAHLLNGPRIDGVSQEEIDLVMDSGIVELDELVAIDSEVEHDGPVDPVDGPVAFDADEPEEPIPDVPDDHSHAAAQVGNVESDEFPQAAVAPEGAEILDFTNEDGGEDKDVAAGSENEMTPDDAGFPQVGAEPESPDEPEVIAESKAGEQPDPGTEPEAETVAVVETPPRTAKSPETEAVWENLETVASVAVPETPDAAKGASAGEAGEPVWENKTIEDALAAFEADRVADQTETAEPGVWELVPDDVSRLATVETDRSGFPTGTIRVTDPADDGLTDADFDDEDPTADLSYGERQAMFS